MLFWTDQECIESLERTRPALIPYFNKETEGMYKADICRGTALYEHGGFYLDVDVGVRHSLWRDLRQGTEFVTAKVHHQSKWVRQGFFQAILGAAPQSPVLERYLELFERHYDGTSRIEKGPLGVLLLKRAWDQIREEHEENKNKNNYEEQVEPSPATELYQEFLYHKDGPFATGDNMGVISPAPTWGERRACHFVVASIANDPSNVEIILETSTTAEDKSKRKIGLQIPVLSRIPGSRMCVKTEQENGSPNSSKINKTSIIESMKWWERK